MKAELARPNGSLLPPGPRLALISSCHIALDVYGCLTHLSRRYGPTFSMPYTGSSRIVFTGDPAAIKHVFGAPPDAFRAASHQTFGPVVGEHSLFLLDGEEHRSARRLIGQRLQGGAVRSYGAEVDAIAREHLDRAGDVVAMNALLEAISLDIIIRLMFGVDDQERARRYRETVPRYLGSYSTALAYLPGLRVGKVGPWARFVRARQELWDLIAEDAAAPQGGMLAYLSAATLRDGRRLSSEEVRDELATLLLAGHETTTRGLAWALYFSHRDARVLTTLRSEMDALGVEPESALTAPYLDAVCNEALRLNPIVPWVERAPVEPFAMLDWTIAPGDVVAPCVVLAHRDEDLFPEPLTFRPERFLEGKFAAHEYFPFGGGARRCIGQGLALHVMKVVLRAILARWELELVNPGGVRPMRRGASVGPSGRLDMRVVARR